MASAVLMLAACGHPGHATSAEDLAQALRCHPTGHPVRSPDGYTLVRCRYQGRRLAIYWRDAKVTSWPGESWSRDELWGDHDQWNIDCATRAQCDDVIRAVGGHRSTRYN